MHVTMALGASPPREHVFKIELGGLADDEGTVAGGGPLRQQVSTVPEPSVSHLKIEAAIGEPAASPSMTQPAASRMDSISRRAFIVVSGIP